MARWNIQRVEVIEVGFNLGSSSIAYPRPTSASRRSAKCNWRGFRGEGSTGQITSLHHLSAVRLILILHFASPLDSRFDFSCPSDQ